MSPFPQGLFVPPKTRPRVFPEAKIAFRVDETLVWHTPHNPPYPADLPDPADWCHQVPPRPSHEGVLFTSGLVANTSPKNAPWKKESKLCFLCVFLKQKRCATSVRSFWWRYRAEISVMCQKTKVSVLRKISKFCVCFAKTYHREPCVKVRPSKK